MNSYPSDQGFLRTFSRSISSWKPQFSPLVNSRNSEPWWYTQIYDLHQEYKFKEKFPFFIPSRLWPQVPEDCSAFRTLSLFWERTLNLQCISGIFYLEFSVRLMVFSKIWQCWNCQYLLYCPLLAYLSKTSNTRGRIRFIRFFPLELSWLRAGCLGPRKALESSQVIMSLFTAAVLQNAGLGNPI